MSDFTRHHDDHAAHASYPDQRKRAALDTRLILIAHLLGVGGGVAIVVAVTLAVCAVLRVL